MAKYRLQPGLQLSGNAKTIYEYVSKETSMDSGAHDQQADNVSDKMPNLEISINSTPSKSQISSSSDVQDDENESMEEHSSTLS